MHQGMRTTYTWERSSRRATKASFMLSGILVAGLASLSWGQQATISDYDVPEEVHRCIRALTHASTLSGRINPFYLRGDFFGDGKLAYAVLVRDGDQQGIMVCRSESAKPILFGAGIEFHGMKNLNFDAWQIHPKTRKVEQGVGEGAPPALLGDAILLEWEESASALLHWDGKRFVWYQQGD